MNENALVLIIDQPLSTLVQIPENWKYSLQGDRRYLNIKIN
jgi:hypothetical protein